MSCSSRESSTLRAILESEKNEIVEQPSLNDSCLFIANARVAKLGEFTVENLRASELPLG